MTDRERELDFYAILEVAPNARRHVIDAAWRQLTKDYHPDLHPGDVAAANRIKRINQAHDVLSDPAKRADYDRRRSRQEPTVDYAQPRPAPRNRPTSEPPTPDESPTLRERLASIASRSPGHVRSGFLPWLMYARVGQWLAVLGTAGIGWFVSSNVPTLRWDPPTSAVVAGLGAGGVVAVVSGSWRWTPLGDLTGLLSAALPGIVPSRYELRRLAGIILLGGLLVLLVVYVNSSAAK